MTETIKSVTFVLVSILISLSLIGSYFLDRDQNRMSGSFTDADIASDLSGTSQYQIEEVYWEIDNRTYKGHSIRHNLSEGTHNVTATVVKQNGEKQTYHSQIRVDRK